MGISVVSPPQVFTYRPSSLVFRVSFLVWLPELLFFLVQCLESVLSFRVTTPDVHIHWHCSSYLHGFAFFLGFSSLRYPVLIAYSSRSPHRAVSFRRVLVRTPGWFDCYPSLTSIFESLLEISQREPGSLIWLQRHFETYFLSLLGLEPLCSSASLSEFVSHQCPYGGFLSSSVEFTSFHSLFTLAFHSSVHIPYTRELYRRRAYLQSPIWGSLSATQF